MVEDITPEYDFKLNELICVVREKIMAPMNPDNKKILIFTAFSDTAEYLYDNISGIAKDESQSKDKKVLYPEDKLDIDI